MTTEHTRGSGANPSERSRRDELFHPSDEERARIGRNRAAKGLGWFTIAVGLAQLAAPRAVGQMMGALENERSVRLIRGVGLLGVGCGVGMLAALERGRAGETSQRNIVAERSRLERRPQPARERPAARERLTPRRGVHVVRAVTIDRPPEEVYRLWREFAEVPAIMRGIESMEVQNGHSHWRAHAARGAIVEWSADLVRDPRAATADDFFGNGSGRNAGVLRFVPAPAGRGTEVRCEVRLGPGFIPETVGRILAQPPAYQIENALRRFKQIVETGEVLHSDASIHAGRHPARPSDEVVGLTRERHGVR